MSKSRYISMKDDSFKAVIGFILILLFIFAISSFFVNDSNNSNSNTGGDGEDYNPNLITFTVGQSTLQAERGMTWSEWINSTYNPGYFSLSDNYICLGSHLEYAVFTSDGTIVLKNYVIVGGTIYLTFLTPDPDPVVHDYYLVGFINGADYGCADDYATIGDYKFVDGKLVVTFEAADNYVFVKTGDNANWYMASAYCTDTTVTLANTTTGTSEKLYVPGGVEITFTLVANEDDTLILSYTTATTSDPDTGEEDNPNLITFTVGNSTLQAEIGMTWSEWINSTYNPGVFSLNDDYICLGSHLEYAVFTSDGTVVLKNDVIVSGAIYQTSFTPDLTPDPDPSAFDYYLVGFINGADYGCADDHATIGDYKFVDGKLVVTFDAADNYVFVKTGDNANWFMASAYCTDTTVTLANTNIGTTEKLYVPGGVEVTFTLVINEDDTLTLSYTAATSDPDTGEDDNPNIITFTVGNDTLQAERGMTWLDWFVTSYNTTNFDIERNYIGYYDRHYYLLKILFNPSGNVVSVFDKIIENAVYTFLDQSNVDLSSPGGGSNAKIYISFKVGSGTLIAEEGMTWEEWLSDSRYNISGFVTDGDFVFESDSGDFYLSDYNEIAISVTDKITYNGAYQFLTDPYFVPDVINPNLITFTVGQTTLQAESGMTWGEWINSGYNLGVFALNHGLVCLGAGLEYAVFTPDGIGVEENDVIVSDVIYKTYSISGLFPTPDPDPDTGGDGEDDNPVLITFTVGRSNLLAESGMTWSQWLADSKYNTSEFVQYGEYVCIGTTNYFLCMEDGTRVKPSDMILEGGVYYFSAFQRFIKNNYYNLN